MCMCGNSHPSFTVSVLFMSDFGPVVVSFKIFLSDCLKLLEHSDKSVRDSVKLLIIEIYRWLKGGIKSLITDVKPVVLKELDEEFKKHKDENPSPCRFVGGLPTKSNTAAESNDEASEEVPAVDLKIDPYDIIEPVDVLSKIPSSFYSEIVEVKWQIRKEALDKVEKILDIPKIVDGDFSSLISTFRNIISTDSNINVISSTVKCISNLANGLRKSFSQNASNLAPLVIGMFKEKRGTIVDNCRNCLDNFNQCLDFETLLTIAYPFYKHKSPSVKEEILKFTCRLISKNSGNLSKPMVKNISTELSKALEDSLPNVRDVASECFATLMQFVGEKAVLINLDSVDDMKKSKIMEKYKKMTDEKQQKSEKEPPKTENAKPTKVEEKKSEKIEKIQEKPAEQVEKPKPAQTKSISTKNLPAKSENNFEQDGKEPPEISISLDTVLEKAIELFGQEFIDLLGNSNWKERLSAAEELEDRFDKTPSEIFDVSYSYLLLSLKPGWKDTNFQVLKCKFKLISFLCSKHVPFPPRIVYEITQILADKISDAKLKEQVYTTLLDLCEVSSVNFVNLRLINYFNCTKSIKNQSEILLFISQSLIEFGMKIDLKAFLPFFKKCADMTNPDIKKSLVELLKTVHLFFGSKFRIMLEDMKPQFLQTLDSEFENLKDKPLPHPTRQKIIPTQTENHENEKKDEIQEKQQPEEIDMEQFINRIDISNQLTPELFAEIGDKNWKIRNAALDKVSEILKKSKYIQPNINDLPSSLALRLSDTNKNLVNLSLNIIKELITAVGKQIEKLVQTMIPPVLTTLSDGKPQIRTSAIACLDEWVTVCGINTLFDNQESLFFPIITGKNSTSKYEIITWLSKSVTHKNVNSKHLNTLIDPVLACLTERSAETRKSVQTLIFEMALKIGVDTIQKKASKLDSTSLNTLKGILDSVNAKKSQKSDKQTQNLQEDTKTKMGVNNDGKKPKSPINKENNENPQLIPESEPIKPVEKEIRIIYKANTQKIRLKTFSVSTMGSKDFFNMINGQIVLYFAQTITNDLLSPDFKKVAKGIQTLISILEEPTNNSEILAALECSDLIIGFISCRLSDANPNLLSKLFDLLQKFLEFLVNKRNKIYPEELECLLPILINKLNDKEIYKKMSKSCIQLSLQLSSPAVVLNYIFSGVDSKLVKLRLECLTFFNNIIQTENVFISELPNCAKISSDMAKLLTEKDNAVRSQAINFFIMFYEQVGQKVFEFIGTLGPKETSILNEKFKRSQINQSKSLDGSNNLNKTFPISKSPNSSGVSDKSLVVENIPDELPTAIKPEFDIYEFLTENDININNEEIKPTEFALDLESEISYEPLEISDDFKHLNVPVFINLKNTLQNTSFDEINFKNIINNFPILFDVMDINQPTCEAIKFSIQKLLDHISNNEKAFSSDQLFDIFEVVSFFLHLASYIKNIDKDTIYTISLKIYEIIHSSHQSHHENYEKVIAVCKGLLCYMADCFPINHLFSVYIKILSSDIVKDSKICEYFIYLFEILQRRFQRRSPIPQFDFNQFFSDFKFYKEMLLTTAYSTEFCEIVNRIFREAVSLLQMQVD